MKVLLPLFLLAALSINAFAQSSLWTNPRGLPSGGKWIQRIDNRTSSEFRTYQNGEFGDLVSFNPQTSEVVKNPVSGKYEAVVREDLNQSETKESSTSEDPAWLEENKEIIVNSDNTELARNAKGELEAVIDESAFLPKSELPTTSPLAYNAAPTDLQTSVQPSGTPEPKPEVVAAPTATPQPTPEPISSDEVKSQIIGSYIFNGNGTAPVITKMTLTSDRRSLKTETYGECMWPLMGRKREWAGSWVVVDNNLIVTDETCTQYGGTDEGTYNLDKNDKYVKKVYAISGKQLRTTDGDTWTKE